MLGNLLRKIRIALNPRYVSRKDMIAKVDKIQEQYGIPESELGNVFKNKDKSKWKK